MGRGACRPVRLARILLHLFRIVTVSDLGAARAAFIDALRSAHAVRRGITPEVETTVRAYARAMRVAGENIGQALVQVKDLVRAHTGYDEPIFTPKVVGWTVAGFFEGTSTKDVGERGKT
jgi:hypothetical protein